MLHLRPFHPHRTHPALSGAAAALAVVAVAVPAEAHAATGATGECGGARFTATAQADLAKISVLDAGVLNPGLPALADVRLASAYGSADSARRPDRAIATGRYADAKLLGLRVPGAPIPGTVAESRAPSGDGPASAEARGTNDDSGGTDDKSLVSVNAGGLATIQLGKSTADARWDDAYLCGGTGPLTRSATMIAGAQFLGGGGATPAIRAIRAGAKTGQPTSLLKLGPTGSTQSATDLVRRKGRLAVSAAAGVALSDLTLFAGTPQEVSIKVITQPTLTVTAAGDRRLNEVDYRPAVLKVTAAGRPVATLDTRDTSVGLDLFGGVATASLLSARISLGAPRQTITDHAVRAEAAALRVEVTLGGAHLLDVALGHLNAQASTPPLTRTRPAPQEHEEEPQATLPTVEPTTPAAKPEPEPEPEPTIEAVPAAAEAQPQPESAGGLALTGANIAAAATGGLLLVVLGVVALVMTRRRRN